jgi:hypothetical protein
MSQVFKFAEFLERHALSDAHFDLAAELIAPAVDGPWMVGGGVRRLIAQMPQESDFDVSFSSVEQLIVTRDRLLAKGWNIKRETDAHVELYGKLGKRDGQLIQLLKLSYPKTLAEVLDFTICQFGYDGESLVCGEYSLWDLARRRLALHKLSFGASSVRRMTKYGKQGFTFCQGTIVSILEAVAKDPAVIRAEITYVD